MALSNVEEAVQWTGCDYDTPGLHSISEISIIGDCLIPTFDIVENNTDETDSGDETSDHVTLTYYRDNVAQQPLPVRLLMK